MTDGLKIYRLEVKNIGGARALAVELDGSHMEVRGPNGAGKTNVLDSIVAAISGRDQNLTSGAEEGEIHLALGKDGCAQYTIDRRIRDGKPPSLVVREMGPHGWQAVRGPAAFLKDLADADFSFDPLAWDRMDPVRKRAALVRAAGVDIESFDARRKSVFDRRTDESRQLRHLEGELAGMQAPANDVPDRPVDIAELAKRYRELTDQANRAALWRNMVAEARKTVDAARERVLAAEKHLEAAEGAMENLRAQRPDETPPEEMQAVADEMEDAQQVNAAVAHRERYAGVMERLAEQRTVVESLTDSLEQIEREKAEAIAQSGLDIPGLEITESDILVNGVPVEKLNRAERVKLGMRIRSAAGPNLRFMLIDDGSELGHNARADIYRIADEYGMQVLLTRVIDDDDAPMEFLMVDGSEHR